MFEKTKKPMSPTNEKVTNHLPDDLSFSIMSKLPLKSLKRLRCVRKSWTLLFENPYFMSQYCNNFISNNHSYYDDTCLLLQLTVPDCEYQCALYLLSGERFENRVKLDWPPPFQEDNRGINILGSGINGILCLYKEDHARVVLWNPTIGEFKVIPPSLVESLPQYQNPGLDLHGFGYDYVRDDYKVIRHVEFPPYLADLEVNLEDFPQPMVLDVPLWEIYSLKSNSWRKLDYDMPTCYQSPVGVHVYMNGLCHWWGDSETHNGETCLVSYDLSNEVFIITPMPLDMDDSFDTKGVEINLVVLNGSISLILNNKKKATFHISILGELGVKDSWTKLFIVGTLPCIEHLIGVGKNGDIFFRKEDDELGWFDLSTQMIEELGVKGELFCSQIVIYK